MPSASPLPTRQDGSRRLVVVSLLAASGGILLGYNTAVISGAMPSVQMTWTLDPVVHSLIVSGLLAGAILGALIGGRLADSLGRRDVIMATAAIFALGTFLCGLAPSPAFLAGGRIVVGLAVGIVSVAAPLYLAEIAPARRRGAFVGLYQLAITTGILLAYVIDAVFGLAAEEWRKMFMAGAALAGLLGFAMLTLPGSPRWMLLHDDEQEARAIFARLRVRDVDGLVASIKDSLARERAVSLRDLGVPFLRSPLGIGIGLFFFQQLGGINVIIYFSPELMMRSGLAGEEHVLMLAAGLGVLNLALTVLALTLIDTVGRRRLAAWSLAGMFVSLLILSGADWCQAIGIGGGIADILLVAGLISYIGWFAVGMGPICWIVISEIYPLHLRGTAMSIPVMAHWSVNLIVSGSLPYAVARGFAGHIFLAYAAFTALGWWWVSRYLPETRGLALEDISSRWSTLREDRH